MKKILSLVIVLLIIAVSLCGCAGSFVKNSYEKNEIRQSVNSSFNVYGGEDIGFSFLYPYGMNITVSTDDGICISAEEDKIPYLLVNKTSKSGMTPKKYFKSSDKQMLNEFDAVESSTICEVNVGNKVLYMTRYKCVKGDSELIIDRYIEIYNNCYIQYTAVCNNADEMNTALYYAARTLSPEAGKYVGEYSEKLKAYTHDITGISIKLPETLNVKDLTMGYFASSTDALILSVICTQDDDGNPIYNRQNFMDRASANPDFVAGYIGADSAFFGSGSKKTINGVEYYSYPMTLNTEGEVSTGEILIANANENGCVVVCYAVNEASNHFDDFSEICEKSVNTIKF